MYYKIKRLNDGVIKITVNNINHNNDILYENSTMFLNLKDNSKVVERNDIYYELRIREK